MGALVLAVVLSVGCTGRTPSPAAVPTTGPAADPGTDTGAPDAGAATDVQPTARVTVTRPSAITVTRVAPRAAISMSRRAVSYPEGIDIRPGPWSPGGDALVAYVVVRTPSLAGPIGHVWTVDAASAQLLWDSGDMEGPIRGLDMTGWLLDGTLVLARKDGMFVRSDGARVRDVEGIDGQPRQVAVSPDGRTAFVNGPDSSWLVDHNGGARAIADRPAAGFDSWSWKPDGSAIALSSTRGDHFVIDVISATVRKIAEAPGVSREGRPPAPRWLADGRVFLADATQVTYEGAPALVHRVVDPATTRARALTDIVGIPPNRWMPADGSSWVSPDGSYILYPAYAAPEGSSTDAALVATWLYDVLGGQAREVEPIRDPVWAPLGDRFAFVKGDGLAVWYVDTDTWVAVWTGGPSVEHFAWSPDGRWVIIGTESGALHVVAADGQAGPVEVAEHVVWDPQPTWSPTGDRFAATLATGDGPPRLTIVHLE